jgi:hypothetical protein
MNNSLENSETPELPAPRAGDILASVAPLRLRRLRQLLRAPDDDSGPPTGALPRQYLREILLREAVENSIHAPARRVLADLAPVLSCWAGNHLVKLHPSGSFAKGTANRSSTDIDIFISLHEDTPGTLREIYFSLDRALRDAGYIPRRQNVSLHVRIGAFSVDLVPAKRQNQFNLDHSLYLRRRDTWIKTNVAEQIEWVHSTGRCHEMRLMKLWRDQHNLDWPSFYVELVTARALEGPMLPDNLSTNLRRALAFTRDRIEHARFTDPGNPANIVSDSLTAAKSKP